MRCLLLFLVLWSYGHAACAQASAPLPQAELLNQTAPDTASAIHRLFAAKRKRQVILSGATFIAAVGAAAVVANNQPPSGGGGSGYGSLTSGPILDSSGVAVLAVGVITLPVVLLEAVLFGGWNKKQEQQTLEAWQQHKETRFLKRRLKPKYFAGPPPAK